MIKNVNVTRLKEQLFGEIPGLREQKNGKFVILTVEEEVDRAIVECSQNIWYDDGITLSKVAKIVRRFLFTKEETFEGDLSKQRQKASVPLSLLNLVSLIFDGETTIENASTNTEAVTANLAQLLRFKAVKKTNM